MNKNIWIILAVVVIALLVIVTMRSDKTSPTDADNATSTMSADDQELSSLNADLDAEFQTIDSDANSL